jgi:hypothetical protein
MLCSIVMGLGKQGKRDNSSGHCTEFPNGTVIGGVAVKSATRFAGSAILAIRLGAGPAYDVDGTRSARLAGLYDANPCLFLEWKGMVKDTSLVLQCKCVAVVPAQETAHGASGPIMDFFALRASLHVLISHFSRVGAAVQPRLFVVCGIWAPLTPGLGVLVARADAIEQTQPAELPEVVEGEYGNFVRRKEKGDLLGQLYCNDIVRPNDREKCSDVPQ